MRLDGFSSLGQKHLLSSHLTAGILVLMQYIPVLEFSLSCSEVESRFTACVPGQVWRQRGYV